MLAPLRSRPLARTWFAVTALCVAVGVVVDVVTAGTGDGGFFNEPWDRRLNVLAYFTIQSNLLVGLSSLLLALDPDRDSPARRWLRLTALAAISVTGIVYHLVLAGLVDLSGWGLLADTLVHTVVPLLAVGGFVLLGPRGRTSGRLLPVTLLFPVAWTAFTLVRGPLVGGFWPYPFVDVDELGWGRVLLNVAVVGVLFVGVAALLHGVDRVMRRTTGPAPPRPVGG
ncbi:Pr6Pr family membrane protein [Aquipuribacter sp. SD81]|uniref:Pr6Pr family membrane protein n=1 Tax=Aquipuribacter sp. SD81 TaxID=3127703 RepID=UPI003018383F